MKNSIYTSTSTSELHSCQFEYNNSISINSIPANNWAFIDMQNLYKSVQLMGWKIKLDLFRQYLADQHKVTKAVAFMGYVKKYKKIYEHIKNAGFLIEFREVVIRKDGTIDGGNVDADLASYVMDYKNDYHKAIIIADDGDYARTIRSLRIQDKLGLIISSHTIAKSSHLIKKEVPSHLMIGIDSIKTLIGS